jgi:glycerol kinase
VSFQTKDIMDSMSLDMSDPVTLIRVDGGMSASSELMQIQADIGGVEIDRPHMLETTALGAALAAGLAVGVWPSLSAFASERSATRFSPLLGREEREKLKKGWDQAIQKSFWVS